MAFDKVVDSAKLDTAMTYTANRIRAKTGDTGSIAWDTSKGFGDAIDAITSGGGNPFEVFESLQSFALSENSTITELVANIPDVTSLSRSFANARLTPLTKIELTVSDKLTSISSMFGNRAVHGLTEIVFKGDFSKVKSVLEAFACGGTGKNIVLKKIVGLDFTSVTSAGDVFALQYGLTDVDIKANTVNVSLKLNYQEALNIASCVNVLNALKDRTGQDALTLTLNAALKTADTGMIYANYVKPDTDTNLYVSCESSDAGAATIAEAITAKNWTIA
nr:MAG TPA: hypothetical protein [Caudoviricetes sp.]